ncbi:MAG: glycosyltransferase family 1 protein [Lentimicrobium sp.]|nr:glycosyltransferase family 1 protein [Lentimicrobium sp.]MDD2527304.1 glycosyltransferase family 1 protein [Lentimicrobiaceae bacterium]MDD4597157.1 glycosyltransferase family 1 protein [Lentimicrobiaceae bacterium]MDY0025409.1 glycosyltransferase family 1 protein [Lentimicrobium sp.]
MPERHLHIVAFDIPYPPNYGGVIDVFYKLKALCQQGIKIHLHCFEYPGRERAPELEDYCMEVLYYPRLTGLKSALSPIPYIVKSRRSPALISRLLRDDYPILFEGIHSCYYLDDSRLKNRMLIYRESNIEHQYYLNLFRAEHRFFKKAYFLIESLKLYFFQRFRLKHAKLMLVVSRSDADYLRSKFPDPGIVHYLPSFHANEEVDIRPGSGSFVLYHGNIEVPENEMAAGFLIKKVFANTDYPLVIAGMNPPPRIIEMANAHPNIRIVANPDDDMLFSLIRDAQVNILVTFQATGLKLKLLNTLYNGRHCLVNSPMLAGTGLESLCIVADNEQEIGNKVGTLLNTPLDAKISHQRAALLEAHFSNTANAGKLISLIFGG